MKKKLLTIALALFCAVLAFTQSASDLLSQGIVAEKKGDNIQALTLYIQAHTADKSLAEAENRMNKMLGIVADGKFGIDTNSDNVGVKSQNLIRLRNEWDKLLLAATELVASNPPLFEAYYFNDVTPQPMQEEDYNNNTMSFTVSAPYLRHFYAPENNEIIHILSAALKNIEEHDVWGAKINGFPNSYFDSTTGNNWLKTEEETYSFKVSMFDNNKKQLASKTISYTVKYDKKKFPRLSIESDLKGKFGEEYYVGSGKYISEGEIDQIVFNKISMENVDSTSFSSTVEYAGKAELVIPITPAPTDVAQLYSADPKKHKKIVGNLSTRSYYDSNTWFRVVDQLESKFSSIDMSEAYGLYWIIEIIGTKNQVRSIVLPEGVETIYEKSLGKFKELESLTIPSSVTKIDPYMFDWEYRGIAEISGKKLKVVNYRGSERQWNTIEGHNNFGNVKINYLYEADKIKKEYIAVKEKVSVAREKVAERLAAEEAERKAAEEAKRKAAEAKKAAEQKAQKQYIQKFQTYYDSGVVPAEDAAELLQLINFYSSEYPGGIKTLKVTGNVANEMGKIQNVLSSQVRMIESQREVKIKSRSIFKTQFFREEKFNLALDLSETEGLTVLEEGQFANMYFLAEVMLPISIVEIRKNAFNDCYPRINYAGTKKQWKKIKIDKEGNETLLNAKINYEYKTK